MKDSQSNNQQKLTRLLAITANECQLSGLQPTSVKKGCSTAQSEFLDNHNFSKAISIGVFEAEKSNGR